MTLFWIKILEYLFPESQTTAAYGKNKERVAAENLQQDSSLIWEYRELDKCSLKRHEHLDRAGDWKRMMFSSFTH